MRRDEIVLAALAAGGEGATYTPVQVQKLFFLIDREAGELVGGPHFRFEPYDYGPFDRAVYSAIEGLAPSGLTSVDTSGRYRNYRLSPAGYNQGSLYLESLPANVRAYLIEIAGWVRRLTFQQLVSSVYDAYPDMKVNSIFRQ